jgi:hypothetical protein
MTRYQSPQFNELLREVEARESCRICVSTDSVASSAYKIYVDGNVRTTPQRFKYLQVPNIEIIAVLPGEHRVVIREAEVDKSNRIESNTVVLSLRENQEVKLVLQVEGAAFKLSQESGA